MATIDGAKAMGLDAEIGSIERGKKADVSVIRLDRLHTTPPAEVISSLVYSAAPEDVDTVLIDGSLVMSEGKLLTIDDRETIAMATAEAEKLMIRAKVSV